MGTWAQTRKNFLHTQEVTVHGTFTFSTSYLAGGEALATGLGTIRQVVIPSRGGYLFEYVPSTGKIKATKANTTTGLQEEPADATNMSSIAGAIPITVFGK